MTQATPGANPSTLVVATLKADATLHWVLLGLSLLVLALAATLQTVDGTGVFVPVAGIQLPELCYARRWLGIECPGCGLTRSMIAIMHGQLTAAWKFNPAGLLVFGIVLFQLPYRVWQLSRLRRGLPELNPVWLNLSWAFVGAALLIQWVSKF
jgi:hypothetical protein